MRVVATVDVYAATVGAAGGNGAVGHLDGVERRIVFRIGAGVRDGDLVGDGAAQDNIAADVQRDAGSAGRERSRGGAPGDIALGEAVQRDGRVVEVGRCAGGAVELPVWLLHGGYGGGQLGGGGLAVRGFGLLPDANRGLSRGVQRAVRLRPPGVEGGENVEQLRRDMDRGVMGLDPVGELAGGLPCGEDRVLAVDLGERCRLRFVGDGSGRRTQLHVERRA